MAQGTHPSPPIVLPVAETSHCRHLLSSATAAVAGPARPLPGHPGHIAGFPSLPRSWCARRPLPGVAASPAPPKAVSRRHRFLRPRRRFRPPLEPPPPPVDPPPSDDPAPPARRPPPAFSRWHRRCSVPLPSLPLLPFLFLCELNGDELDLEWAGPTCHGLNPLPFGFHVGPPSFPIPVDQLACARGPSPRHCAMDHYLPLSPFYFLFQVRKLRSPSS